MLWPLTAKIRSPGLRPAWSAGLPASTVPINCGLPRSACRLYPYSYRKLSDLKTVISATNIRNETSNFSEQFVKTTKMIDGLTGVLLRAYPLSLLFAEIKRNRLISGHMLQPKTLSIWRKTGLENWLSHLRRVTFDDKTKPRWRRTFRNARCHHSPPMRRSIVTLLRPIAWTTFTPQMTLIKTGAFHNRIEN